MMKRQIQAARKSQRGFYLVIAVLIISGLALALLRVVELSRQVQQQTEVEQVAQYAAEALGTIAARDLNIKAISNRAMLANEMAIGQIVGLHTWYEMTRQTSTNIASVSVWIPYVNSITGSIARILNQLRHPMRTGVGAAIALQQTVVKGLSGFQWAFHQAAWLSSIATAVDIVEGSEKELELSFLNHQTLLDAEHLWLRMQSYSRSPAEQQDYVRMVSDSRDPFSQRRTYRWVNFLNAEVHKAGGSEVGLNTQGYVTWKSLDTQQLHLDFWFTNAYVPLGGGASYLSERLPTRRHTEGFGDSYQINWTTSRATVRQSYRFPFRHRVPAYFYLRERNKLPQITLVVREKGGTNRDIRLWGIGRAELYFQRPERFWPRSDELMEQANLYNALWQVRPKNITELERKLIGAQL